MKPASAPLLLYPRIGVVLAAERAAARSAESVEEALKNSALWHDDITFASSGGTRVTKDQLATFAADLRKIAGKHGYPATTGIRSTQFRAFEREATPLVRQRLQMSGSDAASPGVWSFMGAILVPDIARWRWPGNGKTQADHFLGQERGIRNVVGRMWWRAEILGSDDLDRSHPILAMNEDELVALMERPGVAGDPRLARAICAAFLATAAGSESYRVRLMRDAMKRIVRRKSIVSFESLDDDELRDVLAGIFAESLASLDRAAAPRSRSGQP